MKILILFAVAQILKAAYSEDDAVYEIVNGGGDITMINLGTVDGKSYYVDDIILNWNSSRALCQQYGLKLATIKTEAQFAFLKSKYNRTTFSRLYWIGARDSWLWLNKLSALAWDDTDAEIGPLPTDIRREHYGRPYQLCGAYYNPGGSRQYIQSYECSSVGPEFATLCQT